jgi:hypothetical protein
VVSLYNENPQRDCSPHEPNFEIAHTRKYKEPPTESFGAYFLQQTLFRSCIVSYENTKYIPKEKFLRERLGNFLELKYDIFTIL